MFWRSYNERLSASLCRFYDNIRNITRGGSFRACSVHKVADNQGFWDTRSHADQAVLHNHIGGVSHHFVSGVTVVTVQSLKCSKIQLVFPFANSFNRSSSPVNG
ncbi:hypothetical protein EDF79_3092 [Raoultella terrigena]|nr:hypothetical protein EDF79_3092 [Raoultella terrigena]